MAGLRQAITKAREQTNNFDSIIDLVERQVYGDAKVSKVRRIINHIEQREKRDKG